MNGDATHMSNSRDEDGSMWPVHVEVCLKERTSQSFDSVKRLVYKYLTENYGALFMPLVLTGWETAPILRDCVEKIVVSESACSRRSLPIEQCSPQIHVYQPSGDSAYEKLSTNPSDTNEEYNAGSITDLPSQELEGLWESLFYDGDVKARLLSYIYATIGFSDADVDCNLVSWNRVILLHGPPGTGKTSLCRALAQKLSIRLMDRYPKTHLFEINSHSLFSRWFSESGKLVQNLFSSVSEMAREEEEFVILLIDEVESLTSARSSAISGNEPSDALRVVNALLTQIDRLKTQKNVLIMATSNLVKAIDSAFVDRADVIQYIDFPTAQAVYDILASSLVELMEKGIVEYLNVPDSATAKIAFDANTHEEIPATGEQGTIQDLRHLSLGSNFDASRFLAASLFAIAKECKGVSGRSLRRLPVLAHARYIGTMPVPKTRGKPNGKHDDGARKRVKTSPVNARVWLDAMRRVVEDETHSRQRFDC